MHTEPVRQKRRRTRSVIVIVVVIALAIVAAMALFAWLRRPEGPSIVGVWRDTWRVTHTGGDTYTGVGLSDAIEPDSGCPYHAGETEWRITGKAPRYGGQERWVKGSNGRNCEYVWSDATFTLLDDGRTLEVCSGDPFFRTEPVCRKLPRTG
jgi:hypothetical protein